MQVASFSPQPEGTTESRVSFLTLPPELRQDVLLRTFTSHHHNEFIATIEARYCQGNHDLYPYDLHSFDSLHGTRYEVNVTQHYVTVHMKAKLWSSALKKTTDYLVSDIEYAEAGWLAGLGTAVIKAKERYEEMWELKTNDNAGFARVIAGYKKRDRQ